MATIEVRKTSPLQSNYARSKPVLTGAALGGTIGAILSGPTGALLGGIVGGFIGLAVSQ